MAFVPRTTTPNANELYWVLKRSGGYNKCIPGSSFNSIKYNNALPNCTGYAYGRFMEILGSKSCKLSTLDAGKWYLNISDGYERGQIPQVGAVMCWSKPNHPGHVAIVEEVRLDGTVLISQSSWFAEWGDRFTTEVRSNSNGIWGAEPPYKFQGFIYNPAVKLPNAIRNATQEFILEATKHVGELGKWTWDTFGQSNIEWCAAFVSAVSKTVGILNKCIYNTASAAELARKGVALKYGTFRKGPGQGGGKPIPVVGDLVFFRWDSRSRIDEYDCDHVGIVVEVHKNGSQITIVEGNTGSGSKTSSVVSKNSYSIVRSAISGYFHPDWSLVGSIDPTNSIQTGALYSSTTTRQDMMIREVGYINTNYQPSIKSSSIRLSVINYTQLLGAMFGLIAPQFVQKASDYDTDRLSGNARIVVEYLLDKGLNAAAACGVAANIFHESSFNTNAVGDNGTSFGICQWHNERGAAMKKSAGSNWSNNLTGQLDYLWYELIGDYRNNTLVVLENVSDDKSGCEIAADTFMRQFERPADQDIKSIQRKATALGYFSQVVALTANPVST